jgi:hypothetical protein
MYATSFQGGLDITLCLADKEKGEREKRIECEMPEWRKPKLVIHIVRNVPDSWHLVLEESGFHYYCQTQKCRTERQNKI